MAHGGRPGGPPDAVQTLGWFSVSCAAGLDSLGPGRIIRFDYPFAAESFGCYVGGRSQAWLSVRKRTY